MTTLGTAVATGDGEVSPTTTFHHPYTPYDVQVEFMKTVYDVCERGGGQVGILESPTGTGKSLSLICGALTWLRLHKRQRFEAALGAARTAAADEPEWVVKQMLRQRRTQLAGQWARREARLAAARRREREQQQRSEAERAAKRRRGMGEGTAAGRRQTAKTGEDEEDEEAEFLLEDVGMGDTDAGPLAGLSAETRALMERAGLVAGRGAAEEDEDEDDNLEENVTIYYASRTHSQLTQFIAELRRPRFPSSVPEGMAQVEGAGGSDGAEGVENDDHEPVKHIPLSSRQRLCVNPAVSRLGSTAAINDRCAELQKPKKTKDTKAATVRCTYMLSSDNRDAARQFRDTALATLPDIEDLFRLGRTLRVCPYYAARTAVAGAEIVTLPYPLLLQQAAREALGIRLDRRRSIVVVDEAHNLMDAVASVHAAAVTLRQLRRARELLGVYVRRFGRRLKGSSRVMVGQLGRVVQALSVWLEEVAGNEKPSSAAHRTADDGKTIVSGTVEPTALLRHKGADQINLFELVKYVQDAKLAYKVESYAAWVDDTQQDDQRTDTGPTTPVLHALTAFLLALTNLSREGRFFYEVPASDRDGAHLSYLLLSPTHAFASIAASSRAVLLAGGTMAPFDDFRTHLFPQLPAAQITTLSCGHVIPPSNLCVHTLASMRGGGVHPFDFRFDQRGRADTVHDLGMALLNLCAVVPDGVVVFFPSYGYLDEVVERWQQRTGTSSVWDRLQARKVVLRETRGGSSDTVLAAYADAILRPGTGTTTGNTTGANTHTGALLLSVVGGSMSEGINFADRLGRCVVVVGLPFPNMNSPEWKARMEYIESTASNISAKGAASRAFYENACMRAVNQSIGRAIRHRGDYAAIVLVDRRFATDRIRGKLPAWIRESMPPAGGEDKGLTGMMIDVRTFFRNRRADETASITL